MTTPIRTEKEDSALLLDYRARLIAVSAMLCEPVTEKNLRDAKELIAPLYHDALSDTKALRKATKIIDRLAPNADGCFEATAGASPAASPGA